MVVLSRTPRLTVRDLPAALRDAIQAGTPRIATAWKADSSGSLAPKSMADAERVMIEAALKRNNENRTQAAGQLGISRRTLQRKLKDYRNERP
jgi:DNA-binding NtrC family response regulator